jgi:hypothetical protein
MKRKLVIAGIVALAAFVGVILIVGALGKAPDTSAQRSQLTVTPDGQLVVQPSERQKAMFIVNSSVVSNSPAATNRVAPE